MAQSSIGHRIYSARKRLGRRQEDLASDVGAKQTLVSRWERGDSSVPAESVPALAAALRVSDRWLLTGSGRGPDLLPLPAPRARRSLAA